MYLLHEMDFLVNREIPKQLSKSPILSQKFINQVVSQKGPTEAEVDREFLLSLRASVNEEAIRASVRAFQYSLVPLMNKLIKWIPESEINRMDILDPDDDGRYVLKHLHQVLYNLHQHMEKNFYRYMDHEYRIPTYDRLLFREFILDTMVVIKTSPRFRSLDNRLQSIVTDPLETAISTSVDDHITYSGKKYTKALASQLLDFVKEGSDEVWRLYNRLQYIDFNSMDYVRYLNWQFSEECNTITDYKAKYVWLIERKKQIAQQLVEDGLSFLPGQKPLKTRLNEWLKWEVFHVRKMLKLEMASK